MFLSVWANWVVTIITVLSTYILLPYNIHALGDEGYGTWILITSITGYLALLSLGAPMASLRYVARYAAEKDFEKLNRALGTFAGMYLSMGVMSLVIGAGLYFAFSAVYHVPPELLPEARIAFILVVVCVGIGFIQQLPYGIMAAYQDFGVRNLIMGAAVILRLGLNLLLVWHWHSLLALAVLNLSIALFEMLTCWIVLRRRYPQLTIHLRHFDWPMLRQILSFSLFVMLLSMGSQLSYQTDSLVIGGFLALSFIPQYTVANSLTQYLMEFVAAIAVVVMPNATHLHSSGDQAALQTLFLKWSKITFSLTLLTGSFLLVLGPRFLGWWLGEEFEGPAGQVLQILIISFLVFLPARGVAQAILMGIGKPAAPSIAFAIAGVLNLVLSLWWVRGYGLAGVAWGTAVPNMLLGFSMIYFACRELSVSPALFARRVVWRPLLGSIPGLGLLWFARTTLDVHGLIPLMLSGFALVGVFALVWVGFVYRGDPDIELKNWLASQLRFRTRTADSAP
ncbi:MAG: oligosaccharide flippase family protein [Gemmatimonadota bacterium]